MERGWRENVMSKMTIRGAEYPIKKIFSDDFVFTVPLYQRAYAWTTEQSEELLQDLLRAMEGDEEPIEELPPYFLGSIVLIKDDEPDAQIVDGQQRLTTLTILLAALRSLIKSEYVDGLTSFLAEKGNVITGTPKRYRLRLRERDAMFFQKYIQNEGGIEALKELQGLQLSDSQRNIRDNTLSFLQELQKLAQRPVAFQATSKRSAGINTYKIRLGSICSLGRNGKSPTTHPTITSNKV